MMWQHNNIAWQKKKGGTVVFSALHTAALACHGTGMFALAQGKISMAKPSFALAQACRHPTMHPPDIDDKYDFIHVLSRKTYK